MGIDLTTAPTPHPPLTHPHPSPKIFGKPIRILICYFQPKRINISCWYCYRPLQTNTIKNYLQFFQGIIPDVWFKRHNVTGFTKDKHKVLQGYWGNRYNQSDSNISISEKTYLGPCQTSMMELFLRKQFSQKAPSLKSHWKKYTPGSHKFNERKLV